jgi:hypothetical protein
MLLEWRVEREDSKESKEKRKTRLRLMDNVELVLTNMGVNRQRTRALDRTQWASAVREAEAKLKGQ